MSFTNAPITRALVLGLVSSSIAVNLLDLKHYFYIIFDLHVWRYRQLWRFLAYQLCYTNSTEVLFASMVLYQMRIVERMWGSRKYASFLVVSSLLTAIVPPAIMTFLLRPLGGVFFNYLPAGPTPLVFAVLAQYHAMIPHTYRYRIAASPMNEDFVGFTLSDKSYRYALALQLALLQIPGSIIGAAVGWVVGYSWRNDLLPGSLTRWRLPGWIVGGSSKRRTDRFDGLRRRLEDENSAAAMATGANGSAGTDVGRRRGVGQQILDQFRGAI